MTLNGNAKWLIPLCLTATLAIVGWTVVGSLALRVKAFESLERTTSGLTSQMQANNVRISVLENKYDNIQAALIEIKLLLQKYMNP